MVGDSRHPFVLDRERFDALGTETIKMLASYLRALPNEPVDRIVPEEVRQRLISLPLPEYGQSPEEILDFLRREIMPWPIATGHKRSYGWVNSPPAPISLLADAIASTMDCGLDGFDHSAIFLMKSLGRWIMELVGFPTEGSLCLLLSGGSSATLNALTTARHRAAARDGWNLRTEGLQGGRKRLILYASAESHSSIQKCAEQLGIGTDHLRAIETEPDFRMKPPALRTAIEADLQAGHLPFAIVACGGATNTGAIDPLDEIADIAAAFDIWLHVDGAFGAWAALDPSYRDRFRAFSRVDSVTLNPHKWLQVPVDCGALLTRHPEAHRAAYSLTPDYLEAGHSEAPWPYEHMFQLTYGNRALKVWAAIARLGRNGVAELVTRCNALAKLLEQRVRETADLELLAPASLSVVNFRYRPTAHAMDDPALDDLNGRISEAISASGKAHIPTTRVHGRIALRACFLHYENDESDVEHLIALVRRLGFELGRR
ncbi:pyridoxal phosphate-dependent decarboxylase family protein [Dongia deserti]|uniref:pyridoxal phosphate-dependent decarboxylase family protein n=1 Tax=Dongia deserti TaxID=2268030 RepID=UPI000E649AC5|nr:pyridoxal-dependent decarboxylase [Dongia deserti]